MHIGAIKRLYQSSFLNEISLYLKQLFYIVSSEKYIKLFRLCGIDESNQECCAYDLKKVISKIEMLNKCTLHVNEHVEKRICIIYTTINWHIVYLVYFNWKYYLSYFNIDKTKKFY